MHYAGNHRRFVQDHRVDGIAVHTTTAYEDRLHLARNSHDIECDQMISGSLTIVCSSVIMSRRISDHDYQRTRHTPRSYPTALAGRTPSRQMSRLEPCHLVV